MHKNRIHIVPNTDSSYIFQRVLIQLTEFRMLNALDINN